MGLLCPDATPNFLNLFDFSIAPPLLFYTYVPVVIISVLIGIYVLIKSRFSLVSKLLFAVSISFALWVFNIFFAWIAAYVDDVMLAWVITPVFEVLIFASAVYFTHVFIDKNKSDISFRAKSILFLICLPIFIILPTSLSIKYFDTSICEGVPGLTWYYYMYALEIVAIFWIIFICIKKYRSLGNEDLNRKQILYFMAGISSFLALFVGSNLIGQVTSIQEISFIGSIGMVIFIGFLAYLIVEYKAFNVKLLRAQALVVAVIILIASQFFFIQNQTNRVLTSVTLTLVLVFGWWLVRSVKAEVKQKEDLAIANKELQNLDQAKNEFINIASHQLRTPVTVIKGVISMLRDGTIDSFDKPTKSRFYDGAWAKCQKLEDIINDILNATSLVNRKYNVMDKDVEPINLKDFFEKMISEFEPETREREISLTLTPFKEVIPEIYGQKQYLEEAFTNLVTNAIKYTPSRKKTPDVRDVRDGEATINISVEKNGNNIIISVKDNGIGIPKAAMPKLFHKFSRAENARNMYTDGTGLGLFIIKEIVEGHGGKVWVKSEEGKGSTFFVELPINSQKKIDIKEYIKEKASA